MMTILFICRSSLFHNFEIRIHSGNKQEVFCTRLITLKMYIIHNNIDIIHVTCRVTQNNNELIFTAITAEHANETTGSG